MSDADKFAIADERVSILLWNELTEEATEEIAEL